MDKEYSNEMKCANCCLDHLAYSQSCDIYVVEKEILQVKHLKNISFEEARKVVGFYMAESSYASVL